MLTLLTGLRDPLPSSYGLAGPEDVAPDRSLSIEDGRVNGGNQLFARS